MYCDFCGDVLKRDEKVCPSCGRAIKQVELNEVRVKETTSTTHKGKGIPKLIVIIALLVATPIGVILMPFSDFSRKFKIVFFVIVGVWMLFSVILGLVFFTNVTIY